MTGVIEIASLVLAFPAIIELSFKLADAIVEKCQSNKHLKEYVKHFKDFTVDIGRLQLQQDIELGKQILHDPTVTKLESSRLNEVFSHALRTLLEIDQTVDIVLENSNSIFNRKRRMATTKLGEQTRNLEFSINRFHYIVISLAHVTSFPSILFLSDFALTKIEPPERWKYLKNGMYITRARLATPWKDVEPGVFEFLFENKRYKPDEKESIRTNLELLCRRLDDVKLAEGILPLVGIREESSKGQFQLVFRVDDAASHGQILQARYMQLSNPSDIPSLNYRIGLCTCLAEAVLHVHSLALVHKNIRAENILLVSDEHEKRRGPKLFLIGWQYARNVDSYYSTARVGESNLERRLYQHPQRQLPIAEHDCCMRHDIYSLGVCMLEILMWQPLLRIENNQNTVISRDLLETFYSLDLANPENIKSNYETEAAWLVRQDPRMIQRVLIALVEKAAPKVAGARMSSTIVRCLTCLDQQEGQAEDMVASYQARSTNDIGADFVDAILMDIRTVYGSI